MSIVSPIRFVEVTDNLGSGRSAHRLERSARRRRHLLDRGRAGRRAQRDRARAADGAIADVTPAPFNARTRVHEYGGGAYAVADGTVYLLELRRSAALPPRAGWSAAAAHAAEGDCATPTARSIAAAICLICVREDHTGRRAKPSTRSCAIDLRRRARRRPRLGQRLLFAPAAEPRRLAAWPGSPGIIPNMPWDGTELWVGELERRTAR